MKTSRTVLLSAVSGRQGICKKNARFCPASRRFHSSCKDRYRSVPPTSYQALTGYVPNLSYRTNRSKSLYPY